MAIRAWKRQALIAEADARLSCDGSPGACLSQEVRGRGSAFGGHRAKLLTATLPAGLLDLHLVPANRLLHRLDLLRTLGPDDDLLPKPGALLDDRHLGGLDHLDRHLGQDLTGDLVADRTPALHHDL